MSAVPFRAQRLMIETDCPSCHKKIPPGGGRWVGQDSKIIGNQLTFVTLVRCGPCMDRLEALSRTILAVRSSLTGKVTKTSADAGNGESTRERLYVPKANERYAAAILGSEPEL